MTEDEIIAILRENLAEFNGDKLSLLGLLYDVVDELEIEAGESSIGLDDEEEDPDDEFDEEDFLDD